MLAVLAFFVGGSIGSFLNLAADRMPAGRSIVSPRSFCESCNRHLASFDMVPVFSYLWLRGRCRYCRARIPLRFMVVEAFMGALFTSIYFRHGFGAEFIVLGIAVSLLMVVALIDLERGLILNRIIYPSLVVLVLLAPFWTELGLTRSFFGSESMVASLLNSIATGLGAFLVFLAIALAFPKGMGGGDIKLAGVIGLLAGFPGALIALWLGIVSGGLVAIGLLVFRKLGRKDTMPFGPFMALGTIAALLAGGEIISWYQEVGDYVVRF